MLMFHHNTKIKAYSATSRSGRHVLKVELEYDQVSAMAYDMEQLDEQLAAQKASQRQKPAAKRRGQKSIGHTPTLALPSPEDEV